MDEREAGDRESYVSIPKVPSCRHHFQCRLVFEPIDAVMTTRDIGPAPPEFVPRIRTYVERTTVILVRAKIRNPTVALISITAIIQALLPSILIQERFSTIPLREVF